MEVAIEVVAEELSDSSVSLDPEGRQCLLALQAGDQILGFFLKPLLWNPVLFYSQRQLEIAA